MKKNLTLLGGVVVTLLLTGCSTSYNQSQPSQTTITTSCTNGNCTIATSVKGPDCISGKCSGSK